DGRDCHCLTGAAGDRSCGTLAAASSFSGHTDWRHAMDKDRIKGSAQQAKGKVKELAGKATGDKKLEGEGKADKVGGQIRKRRCRHEGCAARKVRRRRGRVNPFGTGCQI